MPSQHLPSYLGFSYLGRGVSLHGCSSKAQLLLLTLEQKQRVRNAVLGCNLKDDRMISVRFQGKPFNITVIQVYAPTSNAEEAEVEQFYEDLQDLLEHPKKMSFSL